MLLKILLKNYLKQLNDTRCTVWNCDIIDYIFSNEESRDVEKEIYCFFNWEYSSFVGDILVISKKGKATCSIPYVGRY